MENMYLLVFIVIASLGTVSGECINGWIRFGDSCYRVFRHSPLAWPEAVFACEGHDAHLLSIETAAETKVIQVLFDILNMKRNENVWIGLSDIRHHDKWEWESTKENATWYNWAPRQPDTPGEHCAILYGHDHFQWADMYCRLTLEYLCERPLSRDTDFTS